MSCYEILDNLLSLLNLLAVIFLAIIGFNTWKKQQELIEKHNIARELLKITHLLRKRINYFRSPFMFAGEVASGYKSFDSTTSSLNATQKQDLGEIGAYFERWSEIAEIGSEYETQKVEAKIVLGIEVEDIFDGIDKIVNDLRVALFIYSDYKKELIYQPKTYISEDQLKKCMKNLMQGYSRIDDEEDPIDKRLDNEIKSIEDYLKKFLKLHD